MRDVYTYNVRYIYNTSFRVPFPVSWHKIDLQRKNVSYF